ncbi:MAG: hypothetical protein ACYCPQ_02815 [Elusimicrobiota bacterium]
MGKKKRSVQVLCSAALFCFAALSAARAAPGKTAGVVLKPGGWFLSPKSRGLKTLRGRNGAFEPVKSVSLTAMKISGNLRPQVLVANQGEQAEEGILIRYDLALKIAPKGREHVAVWAVPFVMDERRVPLLRPGQSKAVPLDPEILSQSLERLGARGFVATELRFEAMLEPRPGERRPLEKISGDIRLIP